MNKSLTAEDITLACVDGLSMCNVRSHYVLPNASWGLGFRHEIDLLTVTKAGFATEIEIKISLSDLKADIQKSHGHVSKKLKYLYFAIPDWLYEQGKEFIPEHAGIISISTENTIYGRPRPEIMRKAKVNENHRPFSQAEIYKTLHLCSMRYWKLFSRLNKKKE